MMIVSERGPAIHHRELALLPGQAKNSKTHATNGNILKSQNTQNAGKPVFTQNVKHSDNKG